MRRKVVTESGRKLGYCHDLRAELTPRTLKVTGLCVGRSGLVEHFGLRAHARHDGVPWSAVVRIEGDRIVVRDV
jgi:sporulation protein YlmC with PRC-barrel domain